GWVVGLATGACLVHETDSVTGERLSQGRDISRSVDLLARQRHLLSQICNAWKSARGRPGAATSESGCVDTTQPHHPAGGHPPAAPVGCLTCETDALVRHGAATPGPRASTRSSASPIWPNSP